MDAPINRYAAGLLALLDIKSMGQNPRVLGPVVQPVFDLGWTYRESAFQVSTITIATAAIPAATPSATGLPYTSNVNGAPLPVDGTGTIAVPNNEIWLIRSMTTVLTFPAVAGITAVVLPAYSTPGAITTHVFPAANRSGITISDAARARFQTVVLDYDTSDPLVVPQGSSLSLLITDLVTAGSNLSVYTTMRLARLVV